jgi:hypothetical protein
MAVRVNHAGHEDAAGSIDLYRAFWHSQLTPDSRNVFVDDKDIAALD